MKSKSTLPIRLSIKASAVIDNWAKDAATEIEAAVLATISSFGVCNILLTGGETAATLYRHWAVSDSLPLARIKFFFGDERCVSPSHPDSNYRLVMSSLFAKGVPSGCEVIRMEAERADYDAAARIYENLLPARIDILLLGLGLDGHIASLFPNSHALSSTERTVVSVRGAKPPYERLTITPRVIACARKVFLFATGASKGKILAEALKSPTDFKALPVVLALDGTWLLDNDAMGEIGTIKGE